MSRICEEDHLLGAAIFFVDVDVKMFDAFVIVVGNFEPNRFFLNNQHRAAV